MEKWMCWCIYCAETWKINRCINASSVVLSSINNALEWWEHLLQQSDESENTFMKPLVTTEFVEWSAKTFILPRQKSSDELSSTSSPLHSYSDRWQKIM